MTAHAWLLAFLLLGYNVNRDGPAPDAADRVTLRDGKVVRGLVTATLPGPRGSVEFLVRGARGSKKSSRTISRGGTARRRERPVRPSHNGGSDWKHGERNGQPVPWPATASCPGSTRSWRG